MKFSINARAAGMVSALLMVLTSTTVWADWEPVVGQKLEDLFANKTHKWTESGQQYAAHYEPGGDLMLLVNNDDLRPSFWRIYGGTGFCIIDRAKDEKSCYEVQVDSDAYRLMPKNKPGTGFEIDLIDGIQTF